MDIEKIIGGMKKPEEMTEVKTSTESESVGKIMCQEGMNVE